MQPIRCLSAVAVAALLGACAGGEVRDLDTTSVRNLPQHGSEFNRALHQNYVTLAQEEVDEAHVNAASYYNTKARQAASGATVLPTRMDERSVPSAHVKQLTEARAEMMRVLDAGGGSKAPAPMARAQAQFDCWVEEQEENHQPKDIALCRNGFMTALDQASGMTFAAAPTPAPAARVAASPPPAAPAPSTYAVFFPHDSETLDGTALAINRDIVAHIKSTNAKSVMVNGHTDRSGDREYNRKLAERRAATVADALEAAGIKPMVGSESFGEDRSAVQTADNVREWQNRRVIVTVQ